MNRFHEQWAVVGTIDPQDGNAADPNTDIVDMSKYSEVAFLISAGAIDAGGTLDFAVYEDEAANMAGEAALAGKAMTQFGDADDNKQVIISVLAEELSTGCRYLRGKMNNSAHSQLVSVVVLGKARYQPATDDDLASVDEIVT